MKTRTILMTALSVTLVFASTRAFAQTTQAKQENGMELQETKDKANQQPSAGGEAVRETHLLLHKPGASPGKGACVL